MDLSKSLQIYLEDLSSNAPTPGGGNVAALCGVLASSLGIMVCNLTIGKKKYQEAEAELSEVKEKLNSFKDEFIKLAKKDNEAFERVMDSYRLPRETNEDRALRGRAIDNAIEGAAYVPAEVINKSKELLKFLEITAKKGNKNSLSDAGVAVSLTSTAAEGAYLNVLINCASLLDRNAARKIITETESAYGEVKAASQVILSEIIQNMKNQ